MNETGHPSDTAMRECLARFVMEFGAGWSYWLDWPEGFSDWYSEWCVENECGGGVECFSYTAKFFIIRRDECRIRVGKRGLNFLAGGDTIQDEPKENV